MNRRQFLSLTGKSVAALTVGAVVPQSSQAAWESHDIAAFLQGHRLNPTERYGLIRIYAQLEETKEEVYGDWGMLFHRQGDTLVNSNALTIEILQNCTIQRAYWKFFARPTSTEDNFINEIIDHMANQWHKIKLNPRFPHRLLNADIVNLDFSLGID